MPEHTIPLTVKQVADILGKTVFSVRKNAERHNIGLKIGRSWVFYPEHVAALKSIPGPGRPWVTKPVTRPDDMKLN